MVYQPFFAAFLCSCRQAFSNAESNIWTSPGGNTPQSSSCMATNHLSKKLSKSDKPDMQDTTGEVGTSSLVMYSGGPLHMAEQRQGDQLKPTYTSSV